MIAISARARASRDRLGVDASGSHVICLETIL